MEMGFVVGEVYNGETDNDSKLAHITHYMGIPSLYNSARNHNTRTQQEPLVPRSDLYTWATHQKSHLLL